MPNILICNNTKEKCQELAREILKHCSSEMKSLQYFTKEEALLSYLEESNPEPSILVIDLKFAQDGVQVAQKSIKLNPWTGVIFYSESGQWDLKVYEIDHAYGLKDPLSSDKLTRAIDKIHEIKSNIIPIKEKGVIHPVEIKTIQYLEQDRRLIHIHTVEQAYSVYIKFDDFDRNQRHSFIRCHNSFVVNFLHVKGMQEFYFLMKNGDTIPISRSRRSHAREEYEAYISRQPQTMFNGPPRRRD